MTGKVFNFYIFLGLQKIRLKNVNEVEFSTTNLSRLNSQKPLAHDFKS